MPFASTSIPFPCRRKQNWQRLCRTFCFFLAVRPPLYVLFSLMWYRKRNEGRKRIEMSFLEPFLSRKQKKKTSAESTDWVFFPRDRQRYVEILRLTANSIKIRGFGMKRRQREEESLANNTTRTTYVLFRCQWNSIQFDVPSLFSLLFLSKHTRKWRENKGNQVERPNRKRCASHMQAIVVLLFMLHMFTLPKCPSFLSSSSLKREYSRKSRCRDYLREGWVRLFSPAWLKCR